VVEFVVGVEVDGVDVEFGDEEEADVVGVVGLGGPDQLDWCRGGQWW